MSPPSNGPEREVKSHVCSPDPRDAAAQASFKYGLVILVTSAATYLPGCSWRVENPVLGSFGSTLVLMSLSCSLSHSFELSVHCWSSNR